MSGFDEATELELRRKFGIDKASSPASTSADAMSSATPAPQLASQPQSIIPGTVSVGSTPYVPDKVPTPKRIAAPGTTIAYNSGAGEPLPVAVAASPPVQNLEQKSTTQQSTTTSGIALTPEYKAAHKAVVATGEAATAAQADAVKAAADYEKVKTEAAAKFEQDRIAAENKRIAEQKQARDAAQAQVKNAMDESEKFVIDPNRAWNNKSTGQKVATVISLMLGGFASGLRGGPNIGQQMLDAEIDRDIEAQKTAFDKSKNRVTNAQTLYGIAAKNFANDDERALATDIMLRRAYVAQAEAEGAKSKDPMVKAQTAAIVADAAKRNEDNSLKLAELTSARKQTSASSHTEMTPHMMTPEQASTVTGAADNSLLVQAPGLDAQGKPIFVLAGTPAEKEKLTAKHAAVGEITYLLDKALAVRAASGSTPNWGATKNELEGIKGDLDTAVATAREMGAISEGDAGRINAIVGDIASRTNMFDVDAGIRKTADRIVGASQARLAAMGLRSVNVDYARAPNGTLVRRALPTGQSYERPKANSQIAGARESSK